jgi:hypothetical protein
MFIGDLKSSIWTYGKKGRLFKHMKIRKSIHTNSIRRLFLMVSAICLLAFTGCSSLDAGAEKGFHTTLIGKTDPRPVPTKQQASSLEDGGSYQPPRSPAFDPDLFGG